MHPRLGTGSIAAEEGIPGEEEVFRLIVAQGQLDDHFDLAACRHLVDLRCGQIHFTSSRQLNGILGNDLAHRTALGDGHTAEDAQVVPTGHVDDPAVLRFMYVLNPSIDDDAHICGLFRVLRDATHQQGHTLQVDTIVLKLGCRNLVELFVDCHVIHVIVGSLVGRVDLKAILARLILDELHSRLT